MEFETSRDKDSINQKSQHHQYSIVDFEQNPKNTTKISSPRSLTAIKQLGYNQSDLVFLSFKDFKEKHPELTGQDKSSQKLRYEYSENLRTEKINEIKRLREKIDLNKISNDRKNRSSSSQGGFNTQSKNNFTSTAIENEQKAFERMKAKNEADLINMVQYALTRELMRKEAEEKLHIQKEKKEKYDRLLMDKRNEEEIAKREKERQQEIKRKEAEENQRKLDQQHYKEAQDKAKKDMLEEKRRMRLAKQQHQEEEKKREEFQMKVNSMLEENKNKVGERLKTLEQKENERKRKLEKKQKQLQLENEEKAQIQKENYDLTLKTMENNLNNMRAEFTMKQEMNEMKRKEFEKKRMMMQKEKDEEARRKADEIKRVQQMNELLLQEKVEEYNRHQKLLSERQKQQEKELEEMNKKRLEETMENNERIKSALKKNELNIEMNKERIMKKIKEKEQSTLQVQKEKELMNKKLQEVNIQKRLEQEEKIRQTEVMQMQRREETIEWIKNKTGRVDKFNSQKSVINEQKRQIQDEITRKKQEYSGKFNQIFHQKNINQNTIRSIQGMFPDNPQIGALLDNFQTLNSESSVSKIKEKDKRGISAKGGYFGTQTNSTFYDRSTQQAEYDNGNHKRADSTKATKAKGSHLLSIDKDNRTLGSDTYKGNSNNYLSIKTSTNDNVLLSTQENKLKAETKAKVKDKERDKDTNKNNNYSIKKMSPIQYSDPKPLTETEINQHIRDYRLTLNKELLNVLAEEKKNEAQRESQIENCRNDPIKERELEKRFGEERAKASIAITKKNE